MRGHLAGKVIGSFAGSFRFASLRGGWEESGHSIPSEQRERMGSWPLLHTVHPFQPSVLGKLRGPGRWVRKRSFGVM